MRAAVLQEYGEPLSIESVDAPDPESVVVDVEACGICRSDWHGWQGDWDWLGIQPQPGRILGHEPAGTVAAGEDAEDVSETLEATSEYDTVGIPVIDSF